MEVVAVAVVVAEAVTEVFMIHAVVAVVVAVAILP